ncbi:MAG: hypothetical protein FWG23_05865 [Eggerthellaceae bacterium]|nr:hypothetical protein [Eggerthellaceae bacterium]
MGFVPGLGSIASGADALLYLSEGNYKDAAVASIGIVPFGKVAAGAGKVAVTVAPELGKALGATGKLAAPTEKAVAKTTGATGSAAKNTNPFQGPVTEKVTVVDPAGNAMPVKLGQQIQGSPDSKALQVKDQYGKPTGERIDGYGHSSQKDPKAQVPHAHRLDDFGNPIVDEAGNPHLPIYLPN